jgi:hypothetical protein
MSSKMCSTLSIRIVRADRSGTKLPLGVFIAPLEQIACFIQESCFHMKPDITKVIIAYDNHLVSGENLGAFDRYANRKHSFKLAFDPL